MESDKVKYEFGHTLGVGPNNTHTAGTIMVAQAVLIEQRVVVHEIGHQFGIADGTGGLYDYGLLLNPGVNPDFTPGQLDMIRDRGSPGI